MRRSSRKQTTRRRSSKPSKTISCSPSAKSSWSCPIPARARPRSSFRRACRPAIRRYFAVLDALRPADAGILVRGEPFLLKEERDRRVKLAADIETAAAASPMKAYFFIALAVQVRQFKDVKPQIDPLLAAHPDDLSLQYRMLAVQPAYSGEAARDLIGRETGFGEVHLLVGQRAVLNGNLAVRLSRADACARAVARQRVDCARAGKRHVLLRALCGCAGAVRPHSREPGGCRLRAAGAARPREVAELSEAPRRGHRTARSICCRTTRATARAKNTTGGRGTSCSLGGPSLRTTMRRPD